MDLANQLDELTAGADRVISAEDLEARLRRGDPLRVKLGIDPTASDIHLGFAVVLRKLRQFQDLGHQAVLILGDLTARVGDPSGRSATRPRLTAKEVDAHAETYLAQVVKVLDPDRLEVHRNSEWLGTMGMEEILALAGRATVAQLLERDDFQQRYRAGAPISLVELLYPLLQGWDSVMVRADVELGGSDQLFNNLMGRALQGDEGQDRQVVMTMPLLVGTDGVRKMSKSYGNYVGIAEAPSEQFGKIMRIPDSLMASYFALATGWGPRKVAEIDAEMASGALAPAAAKRLLARTIVDLYHGEGAGTSAEGAFDRVFRSHEAPEGVPVFRLGAADLVEGRIRLARLLALAGLVRSNAEGRRKILQGGVRLDGARASDPDLELEPAELDGAVVQVGRRAWAKIET